MLTVPPKQAQSSAGHAKRHKLGSAGASRSSASVGQARRRLGVACPEGEALSNRREAARERSLLWPSLSLLHARRQAPGSRPRPPRAERSPPPRRLMLHGRLSPMEAPVGNGASAAGEQQQGASGDSEQQLSPPSGPEALAGSEAAPGAAVATAGGGGEGGGPVWRQRSLRAVYVLNDNNPKGGAGARSPEAGARQCLVRACEAEGAQLTTVNFGELDFGETAVLDTFYDAGEWREGKGAPRSARRAGKFCCRCG